MTYTVSRYPEVSGLSLRDAALLCSQDWDWVMDGDRTVGLYSEAYGGVIGSFGATEEEAVELGSYL